MMNKEQLQEIKDRCEAATPGPWGVSGGGYTVYAANVPVYFDPDSRVGIALCLDESLGWKHDEAYRWAQVNASFIAHARQDIPALLAYVAKLEAQLGLGN